MSYNSGPQSDIPSISHKSDTPGQPDKTDTHVDLCPRCGGDHDRIDRREPCLVIALENEVGIPVDTLGVVVESASFDSTELMLIDWYVDHPGKSTRRAMRPAEFKPISEG
jgi:hypothetical protein